MANRKVCDMDCFNCKFPDCIKSVKGKKELTQEQKNANSERVKSRYYASKASGICVACQRKPKSHGLKCQECWERQKRLDAARYGIRKKWEQEGKCRNCGGERKAGKKTCEYHYNILVQCAATARKAREK